jgi:hypothetical protein
MLRLLCSALRILKRLQHIIINRVFNVQLCEIVIPKPVWAAGFALEQTLRDATLAVFSFTNFKTASADLVEIYFLVCKSVTVHV